MKFYPDTAQGARQYLLDDANPDEIQGLMSARFTPDPVTAGCWLVEAESWTAVVYVGRHPLAPDVEFGD